MAPRWSPQIGDPTFIGWLTVAAYLFAALACALVTLRRGEAGVPVTRDGTALFWAALSLLLLFLGINKELDLQSLFTQAMRDLAQAQGWYDYRRVAQAIFVWCIACVGLTAVFLVAMRLASLRISKRIALIGLVFLYSYIFIRASSFHHVDLAINRKIMFAKVNWILEIGGIAVIIAAALLASFEARS